MRTSGVRKKWSAGRPALCTVAQLTDPVVAELVSSLGFDCIWIDLEHSPISTETVCIMIQAARIGKADVMARPAKGEFFRMARLLEAGAMGILYPRCDNAGEAREVVQWAKFHPLGQRGFAGGNADAAYGVHNVAQYVDMANRETFLALQIESPDALENAGSIASVEGVDMLFFGPNDYSVAIGRAGELSHTDVKNACRRCYEAATGSGKHFGTLCFTTTHARELLDMGASFLNFGSDIGLLKERYLAIREEFRPLGISFDTDIELM